VFLAGLGVFTTASLLCGLAQSQALLSAGVLYLQRVLGYDSLETGLAFLPVTLVIATLSLRYSDRLTMRFGARTVLLPGLARPPRSPRTSATAPRPPERLCTERRRS
jgi:peptidoglycan/LPS O-acetylase OafA/YrhL